MYLKNKRGERYPGFPYGGQLAYHSHKFLLQHNKITQVSALWFSSDKDNITLYMDDIPLVNEIAIL